MSGSMREKAPGKWELRVYVGPDPITKRPRQRSVTFTGGVRAARKELDRLVVEAQDTRATDSHTFDELADEWIRLSRSRLRPSTIEAYEMYLKVRIRPVLGTMKLRDIETRDLDRLYNELEQAGLARSSVRLCHSIISAAFTQARRWKWITEPPTKDARPPTVTRRREAGISVADLQRLIRAARPDEMDMTTGIVLAVLTGARRGELIGLQWGDVDRDAACITFERAWVPQTGGQRLGPLKVGDTRTVPLGAVGIAVLARYKLYLAETLPDFRERPDGWLLSYDGGTTPLRAKGLSQFLRVLGGRLDPPLDVHLHQLRHFAATQLGAHGTNPRVTADLLGHRGTDMTMNVYQDHLADELRAAVDHLGSIVAPALEP